MSFVRQFDKSRLTESELDGWDHTAIAETLSDVDAEIRAVEEKLSKARGVKAGMMSALLTRQAQWGRLGG